jgi:hypothetical protein
MCKRLDNKSKPAKDVMRELAELIHNWPSDGGALDWGLTTSAQDFVKAYVTEVELLHHEEARGSITALGQFVATAKGMLDGLDVNAEDNFRAIMRLRAGKMARLQVDMSQQHAKATAKMQEAGLQFTGEAKATADLVQTLSDQLLYNVCVYTALAQYRFPGQPAGKRLADFQSVLQTMIDNSNLMRVEWDYDHDVVKEMRLAANVPAPAKRISAPAAPLVPPAPQVPAAPVAPPAPAAQAAASPAPAPSSPEIVEEELGFEADEAAAGSAAATSPELAPAATAATPAAHNTPVAAAAASSAPAPAATALAPMAGEPPKAAAATASSESVSLAAMQMEVTRAQQPQEAAPPEALAKVEPLAGRPDVADGNPAKKPKKKMANDPSQSLLKFPIYTTPQQDEGAAASSALPAAAPPAKRRRTQR